MVDSFELNAGRLLVVQDDQVVFDTDGKAINLIGSAAITKTAEVITYPDFLKDNAVYYEGYPLPPPGIADAVCSSYVKMYAQEWGPAEASPRTLADKLMGTVPAGTDYLDVRLKLTQTGVPSKIFNTWPIAKLIKEGQWINCPGGSCPLESRGDISRLLDFYISGTDVYLRRRQSVVSVTTMSWVPGNASGITNDGWTYGSTPTGFIVYSIQAKGPGGNVNKNRGGSNACSLVDPSNFRSIWTGDIIITPGRYA